MEAARAGERKSVYGAGTASAWETDCGREESIFDVGVRMAAIWTCFGCDRRRSRDWKCCCCACAERRISYDCTVIWSGTVTETASEDGRGAGNTNATGNVEASAT